VTRKTTAILYLLCGLTGGLLAVIQNRSLPAGESDRTTEAKARPGKSRQDSSTAEERARKSFAYASARKWSQLMEEGRIVTTKNEPPPSYRLHDDDGAISDKGIAAAGLTGDQAHEIKSAMSDAREAMFRLFAEKVEPDRRKPKDKADEIWYRIPNQLEDGAKVFNALQERFEAACGKEKSEELVRAMNPHGCYANFGRRDVSIRWSRGNMDGQEPWKCEVHLYDAPTGQKTSGMMIRTAEDLKKHFGKGVPWPGN
jgi:hypothetical protein